MKRLLIAILALLLPLAAQAETKLINMPPAPGAIFQTPVLNSPSITGPVVLNETLGAELVPAIDASCTGYTLTAGWSCSSGTFVHAASGGTGVVTAPAYTLTQGKQYRVAITITGTTASGVSLRLDGTATNTTASKTTVATHVEYVTFDSTTGSKQFTLLPTATTFNGTVTAISIREATHTITSTGGPVRFTGSLTDATANESVVNVAMTGVATALGTREGISIDDDGTGGARYVIAARSAGASTFTLSSAGAISAGTGVAGFRTSAGGLVYSAAQAVTCSAGAGVAALTITPSSAYVEITNSDADGCNITMSETGATAGSVVRLVLVSTAGGNVAFADSAGVLETSGSTNNMDSVGDNMVLIYSASAWNEVSRAGN